MRFNRWRIFERNTLQYLILLYLTNLRTNRFARTDNALRFLSILSASSLRSSLTKCQRYLKRYTLFFWGEVRSQSSLISIEYFQNVLDCELYTRVAEYFTWTWFIPIMIILIITMNAYTSISIIIIAVLRVSNIFFLNNQLHYSGSLLRTFHTTYRFSCFFFSWKGQRWSQ